MVVPRRHVCWSLAAALLAAGPGCLDLPAAPVVDAGSDAPGGGTPQADMGPDAAVAADALDDAQIADVAPEPTPQCVLDTDCDPEPGNPCIVGDCHEATGECLAPTIEAGLECEDGSHCTEDDACSPIGVCEGTTVDCDDGNPCTDATCLADVGCLQSYTAWPCDDGDPCTSGDQCSQGVCSGYHVECE